MHIDRVFLVASPSEDVGEDDPEKKALKDAAAKHRTIDEAEKAWLARSHATRSSHATRPP